MSKPILKSIGLNLARLVHKNIQNTTKMATLKNKIYILKNNSYSFWSSSMIFLDVIEIKKCKKLLEVDFWFRP